MASFDARVHNGDAALSHVIFFLGGGGGGGGGVIHDFEIPHKEIRFLV